MFSIGVLSIELIVIIAVFIALIFLSWRNGKEWPISLIIAGYISIPVVANLPFNLSDSIQISALTFIVVYALIWFLIRRAINLTDFHSGLKRIFFATALSLALIILWGAIYYYIAPSFSSLYFISNDLIGRLSDISLGILLLIPIAIVGLSTKH